VSVNYYQGPPNVIAFTLLWRRVGNPGDTVDLTDAEDGNDDKDYFFLFDPADSAHAAQPQDPWDGASGVLSRWEIVPASAFSLPAGVTNPCAS
jgi:hypothetical protein